MGIGVVFGLVLGVVPGVVLGRAASARATEPAAPVGSPPASGPAGSAEPGAWREPPAGLTPVYVVGGPGVDPGLLEVIEAARSHLRGQGVELGLVEPAPGEPSAMRARALVSGGLARGVFWLDERTPGEVRVFLLDAEGSAYVRRVPVDPEGIEASREAVWHIVESGSLALASGEAVAMEQARADELILEAQPEPPPPSEPRSPSEPVVSPEVSPPPPPPRMRWRVGLAYLGSGFASAIPWSSGAAVDGAVDLGTRWRLALGYGVLVPGRGEPVVTWRHRGELRFGPRFSVAPRVELGVLVGAGMEALRWRQTSGDGTGWRVTGLAALDGTLGVRLAANLWLTVEPGVGLLLGRFAFVECAAGATRCDGMLRRVVLEPWLVRPRARVGLAVRF